MSACDLLHEPHDRTSHLDTLNSKECKEIVLQAIIIVF